MKKMKNDEWCKRANIAMILDEKDTADIAKKLGYSRQFVSGIINGNRSSSVAQMRISHYLGVAAIPDRAALEKIRSLLMTNEKSM